MMRMRIAFTERSQDQQGALEDEAETQHAGTRRDLLAAAGGFALAASGLVLPDWLAETEARSGALGGAKGGRHGQNRKGRNR